jgi:fatty-acyl-CoA synthase
VRRESATVEAVTIPQALELAARGSAGVTVIDRDLREDRMTWADVASAAQRASGALGRYVDPGDRVCLLSATSLDLVVALLGAWRAGAVPSVLPLPRRSNQLTTFIAEVQARVRVAGAGALVCADELLASEMPLSHFKVPVLALSTVARGASGRDRAAPVSGENLALLQFTSGSTAPSRAVPLRHSDLLGNIADSMSRFGVDPDSEVVVSWLPLFHDMGLIAMFLGGLAFGVDVILEPTHEFIARPGSWLDALSRFSGTVTASPAFGYALAARDLALRPRDLDLSAVRIAANGGEPIFRDALDTFVTATRRCRFRPRAMTPVYGLAEATLAVTTGSMEEPRVESVSTRSLSLGDTAQHVDVDDLSGKPMVSCGAPVRGTEVAILGEHSQQLRDRQVGEIWVRSAHLMSGYWGDDRASAEVLRDGWLWTGDLGFMSAGELFVCGRTKDVIFLGGRNLFAEDYEFFAERVQGVRKGNVIAFAVPERERMVVVAETATSTHEAEELVARISETLCDRMPRSPEEVVLVPPGTLPKTSSGKRQRAACRRSYEAGELPVLAVSGARAVSVTE